MTNKKNKIKHWGWKDIFNLLLFGLFIYLIWTRWGEVLSVLKAALTVKWQFLLVALGVWLWWQINLSMYYQQCYEVMNLRTKWYYFFDLTLAANFLGMIAPSGGFVATVGYIINDGCRRGFAKTKLLLSSVVYWMVFYSVFVLLLIVSMFYLLIKNVVADFIVIPALIMFALIISLFVFLIFFLNDLEKFKHSTLRVVDLINRLRSKFGLGPFWDTRTVRKYAYEIYEGYHFVLSNIFRLRGVLLHAFLHIMLFVGLLAVLVKAVDGDWTSWGVLLATYVIASLLMVVSITPSGVGVVEVAMTMILSSFLLTVEKSLVVVLLFRLYQFWLPLFSGYLMLRWRGK